jgi:hypothetical protein
MKMPGMPVRMFEAEPTLAEVDLAGDPGINHPLERAIDRSPADPLILTADQIDEVLRREMALLPEEDVDDEVPFARPLAAGRAEAFDKGRGRGFHRLAQ